VRRHVRPFVVGAGIGALAGLVVGGGGARIAMRLIALADDREDFGRVTSAQGVVGDFTADGTLAVFGSGFALGILGGVAYVALRTWLPTGSRARTLSFAWLVVGLGLLLTVEGNQEDFTFLHLGLSLGLFGVLLLLYGLVVPPLVDRLAPLPHARVRGASVVTTVVVALALVAVFYSVRHAFDLSDRFADVAREVIPPR
jgi:hypothetical protein